jgi:hypothetical protein
MPKYGTSQYELPREEGRPLRLLEGVHSYGLRLLDDPDVPGLDVVAWLSAHLSTMQRIVHPALVGAFGDDEDVASLRAGTVQIERTLRSLERLYSGDTNASGLDEGGLRRSLAAEVSAQADQARPLLQRLAEHLSEDEQRELCAAYDHALEHAPTRPHPHAPHGARLGALAFRINEIRDRIMDTMDSRSVPTPRPDPSLMRPGRWGDYLLGHGSGADESDEQP